MKFNGVALVVAACAAPYFPSARADIPVHCLRTQVAGTWRFLVGKSSADRSVCGHQRPDVEEKQPARSLVDTMKDKDELTVELLNPNVAKANGETGTWTMVYDEGFEVRLGERVFFAFSNYTYDKSVNPVSPHNVTHCGETMVGWYNNKARTEFGCYYGSKQGGSVPAPVALPARKIVVKKHEVILDHATQTAKVAKLNKKLALLQAGWKARVMPQWFGHSISDLNNYAGIQRVTPTRDLQRDMLAQHRVNSKPTRSFLQRKNVEGMARAGPIPETFDWSDVNSVDYTEPVMDQGSCGSCYDASTMRMLTARHKITQNNTEAVPWSINFPLFCAEFNQGCKGGFGFLTTKWSEEVGLLPATCMRYNTAGSCSLECDLDKDLKGQKRYRAANHRYVNSWYGNFKVGEMAILEEMYRYGPVVLSFEPSEDFMFYSGGVFNATTSAFQEKLAQNKSHALVNHVDFDQQWSRVDHAVVAVGYGVEDGQRYWRIQNSWGADWGEDGYFRITRGTDESGIESGPEAADVIEDEQNGRQVTALFAELAKHSR